MKRKKRSILVTGAGGFIGANLTRHLVENGYSIHVVWKNSSSLWRLENIWQKLTFHKVSLLNKKELKIFSHITML